MCVIYCACNTESVKYNVLETQKCNHKAKARRERDEAGISVEVLDLVYPRGDHRLCNHLLNRGNKNSLTRYTVKGVSKPIK